MVETVLLAMIHHQVAQGPVFQRRCTSINLWDCKFINVLSVDLAQLKSSRHLKDSLSLSCYKFQEAPSPAVILHLFAGHVFIVIQLVSVVSCFSPRTDTTPSPSLLSRTSRLT